MEDIIYLDLNEAAELLKVKPGTMYQKVWKREIPTYKPFGRKLYFKRHELLELLDRNRRDTADEIKSKAATYCTNRGIK